MTYYLLGDSHVLDPFQERLPFPKEVVRLSDMDDLEKELETATAEDVFFLGPGSGLEELNQMALVIRNASALSRVIYVTAVSNARELKAHQSSAAGGDAYVTPTVDRKFLQQILEGLESTRPNIQEGLKEKGPTVTREFSDLDVLKKMKGHPISQAMDELFISNLPAAGKITDMSDEIPPLTAPTAEEAVPELDELEEFELGDLGGEDVSKDDGAHELSLDEGAEQGDEGLELTLHEEKTEEDSLDLDLAEDSEEDVLELGDEEPGDEDTLSLDDDGAGEPVIENLGELDLSLDEEVPAIDSLDLGGDMAIDLSEGDGAELDLNGGEEEPLNLESSSDQDLGNIEVQGEEAVGELGLGGELEIGGLESSSGMDLDQGGAEGEDLNIDFGGVESGATPPEELSEEAMAKLAEIDAIMEVDATQAAFHTNVLQDRSEEEQAEYLDRPLVSDDINLENLDLTQEDDDVVKVEEKPKRKKKVSKELGTELKELSGTWSGEMERTQATLANLRADREELLERIQQLEEEKVLHSRQMLTVRAELDERKIELSIIRKKLNEEINELKDRLKLHDERRLILEEKNRLLMQELDKAGQKSKLDVKKVQMRERELEQKLELLKADAETQIRNRDLKILELKRKIDAMEFDMESITQQEKRSVESRYELEDKLDKAIKTLRTAITVLEDESQRGNALEALKKNIDV